jgi:hypothetical protein
LKKPAVPVLLSEFEEQETNVALLAGMPKVRIHYIRGPIWAKTNEQIRKQVIEGKSPVTGKPCMAEIVEMLTKPLTADEKKTGEIKRDRGPATYAGTPDELQKLYLEKRYTDFMPIILPTEEKVNEMLKGTSHAPDEVVGRMNPGSDAGDTWSYTVKDCAVNAVMAGAKPEYFPLILAIASGNMTSINISDNGFAAAAVVNGRIREEIGLNSDVGAVGPYAHANVVIGRAWNLISINGGNCGKIGTTYMGTVGNAQNALATIIAENEEASPFEPLAVRRSNAPAGMGYGFGNAPGGASPKYKKGDNVVTLLTGWGVLSAANWKVNRWQSLMDYPKIIKDIHEQQNPGLFGSFFILSPPIANFVKDAGYDTVEALNKYVTQPDPSAPPAPTPAAKPGGPGAKPGGFGMFGGGIELIVTGASNNNYWMAGGLRPGQAIAIDKWR